MDKLRAVSKDIISLKLDNTLTLNEMNHLFYQIMRKHGICQGTKNENGAGVTKNNFEWTICRELFISQITAHITMDDILGSQVPEDLQHY